MQEILRRRHAPCLRRGVSRARAGPGADWWPIAETRRPGRGDRRAERRHREPGRCGARARQGRRRPGRAVRVRRDRDGVPDRRERRDGCPDGPRQHRSRDGCARGRAVDLGARPLGRHIGRALPGRARLGHDRSGRRSGGAVPVPARPRRLLLCAASWRAPRDRCVRAEGQTQGAGGYRRARLRRVRRGLGPLRAGARRRARATAGAQRRRVPSLPARTGELHARRQLPHRRVPRGRGTSSSRRG